MSSSATPMRRVPAAQQMAAPNGSARANGDAHLAAPVAGGDPLDGLAVTRASAIGSSEHGGNSFHSTPQESKKPARQSRAGLRVWQAERYTAPGPSQGTPSLGAKPQVSGLIHSEDWEVSRLPAARRSAAMAQPDRVVTSANVNSIDRAARLSRRRSVTSLVDSYRTAPVRHRLRTHLGRATKGGRRPEAVPWRPPPGAGSRRHRWATISGGH